MDKKIKEANDLTNKLISDAVKNIQSNNDDYIIDYFAELISSIKIKLGATQFKSLKDSLQAEISIRPDFMSVLDSAIVFARRIIYLNLILNQSRLGACRKRAIYFYILCPLMRAFLQNMRNKIYMDNIPTDYVGCNTRVTNRHENYRLTKGDRIFALFSALSLFFIGLFILFSWMLDIASR